MPGLAFVSGLKPTYIDGVHNQDDAMTRACVRRWERFNL